MKHLVLGFTGGLGRATAKALSERNEEVVALVRDLAKAEKYIDGLKNIFLIQGDGGNAADVERASDGCTNLFYCVNVPYPKWESEARQLLQVSIDIAVKKNLKFVFPGNVYNFGNAQQHLVNEGHPQAASTKKGKIRIEMEQMLLHAKMQHGLRYTIVRMPSFYGPYVINGFSETIFANAIKGKKLQWFGRLDNPTDLIFIEDGGEAMVIAGLSPKADGYSFNVPGYGETTAQQLLKEVVRQAPRRSKISSITSEFLIGLVGIFDPMAKEFKEMMYLQNDRFIMTGEFFRGTFGTFPATPYEEGIRKTLEWAKNFFK